MNKYIIIGIQPDQVECMTPVVNKWIQDALDHGGDDLTSEQVIDKCANRLMQLWLVVELPLCTPVACYVTEIDDLVDNYRLNVTCLGGDGMGGWLGLVEKMICDFAAYSACTQVSMSGRRGWLKELKKYSWKEATVKMIKEV